MHTRGIFVSTLVLLTLQAQAQTNSPKSMTDPAAVHQSAIVIDTHADTPQRFIDELWDFTDPLNGGMLNYASAKQGNLAAQFFSIWVDPGQYSANASAQDIVAPSAPQRMRITSAAASIIAGVTWMQSPWPTSKAASHLAADRFARRIPSPGELQPAPELPNSIVVKRAFLLLQITENIKRYGPEVRKHKRRTNSQRPENRGRVPPLPAGDSGSN